MDFFSKLMSYKASGGNSIVGVVIEPREKTDLSKVETELKARGFDTSKKESVENFVVYKQGESQGDEVTFKIKDGVFVSVAGVAKTFEPFFTGESFMDNMKQGGFFPNLTIATELLRDTIANIMFNSDNKPTEKVDSVINEFKQFVMAMLQEVPETAFKLADLDLMDTQETKDKDTTNKGEEDMNADEIKAVVKESINDLMTTEQEAVLKKMSDMLDSHSKDIRKQNEEISGKIDAVSGKVDALEKDKAELSEKLETVSKDFTEYKEKLQGILNIGSDDADPEADPEPDPKKKQADDKEDVWKGSALDIFEEEIYH